MAKLLMPGATICLLIYGAVAPVTAVLALRQSAYTRFGLTVMAILVVMSWLEAFLVIVVNEVKDWCHGARIEVRVEDWLFALIYPLLAAGFVAIAGCVAWLIFAWEFRNDIADFGRRIVRHKQLKLEP